LILIAGKGHETYQEVEGIRYPMDDKLIATHAMLQKYAKQAVFTGKESF